MVSANHASSNSAQDSGGGWAPAGLIDFLKIFPQNSHHSVQRMDRIPNLDD